MGGTQRALLAFQAQATTRGGSGLNRALCPQCFPGDLSSCPPCSPGEALLLCYLLISPQGLVARSRTLLPCVLFTQGGELCTLSFQMYLLQSSSGLLKPPTQEGETHTFS